MPPMPPMGPGGRKPGGPHGARLTMEKPKDAKNTLKKLIGYIGRNRYLFFALIGVMLIITLLNLAAPSIQQIAIDCITLTKKKTSVDFGALGKTLIGLGTVYLLSSVFTYMQGIFSAKLSQYTVKTMRKDLFSSLVRLPIKYLDTHSHGDIMSRMTNDVENISTTISQSIGSLISGVLTIVGTVVIMLLYSPLLTLISLSTVFLTIFVSGVLTKYMKKYFIKQQVLLGEINGEVEEMVVGYRTVVSYGKEQDAVDKFEKMSNNLKKCGIKAQIFGGVMGPCMNLISNFGFILIAAFGGWFAIKGFITVGTIQAFILYSKQFSRPINEIANQFANIQTAIAGAERIFEVMDADKETDEGKADFEVENVKGDIDFKHIDFSYVPEKQVLKDLDLEVKAGQKIAIVGPTGAGKTTLVNLLMRFYEINSGEIKIDGVSTADIKREDVHSKFCMVLQDTWLFEGSIRENLIYCSENKSEKKMREACKAVGLDHFIRTLQNGYDTILNDQINLSQGQKQQLTIARAMIADKPILILDEATSSIDTRTEQKIQKAMDELMKNRTSFVIAHRLSTIKNADLILVLKDGDIIESGNHQELMSKNGFYADLYNSQFEQAC